ncbi:3-oxoadipate enol-lactonase [Bordetella bronchialis]|uniref:3-oxoadipate enol-lactonase n=1 Tax=Bordetella bronchialis TaxID=463025 RepID=A0A193FSF9_9BORD|nr:3-oxoadipate enol-lactonase [Bordetella bronchialis]ANN70565.1 3-oxoadipate enol-lactonase [Bordetella bronchialis]
MPFALNGTTRIYWRGDGSRSLPALVLGNSLGTDFTLWDPILPRLMRHFRVIRFDMRGHGASDAPDGDYTMAQLAGDLAAVVQAAGLDGFHYCGVSLGGMVGMAYAQRPDHRLRKLVLSNTAVRFPQGVWEGRIADVMRGGMASIADAALGRFFTPGFLALGDPRVERVRETLLSLEPHGYAGCCAAIRDMDIAGGLPAIGVPTLVLTGAQDASTPPVRGTEIAAAIPGATVSALPGAHIPMIELPVQWGDAVLDFLLPREDLAESARYALGLERRREILGRAYVDERLAARTEFNTAFQEMITQLAWGRIWTSSRIDDVTRRIVVIAMTAALGRWEEYELHVGAALRAGVEPRIIEESLFMVSVYAGVPAANTGFAIAGKVLKAVREDASAATDPAPATASSPANSKG